MKNRVLRNCLSCRFGSAFVRTGSTSCTAFCRKAVINVSFRSDVPSSCKFFVPKFDVEVSQKRLFYE